MNGAMGPVFLALYSLNLMILNLYYEIQYPPHAGCSDTNSL